MTDKLLIGRAVVQQALEALIVAWQQNPRWQITESMHALRAALAQQSEPVCKCDLRTRLVGDGCEVCNPELAAQLAQQPEPVAWMVEGSLYASKEVAQKMGGNAYTLQALYTAPPQRPPLTDEEIMALWQRHIRPISFARAIRARGEKE